MQSNPYSMLELRDQFRVRQWFLCLVALCYIAAFSSLYVQWPGLYGPRGILPAHTAEPNGFSLFTVATMLQLPLQATAEVLCIAGTILSSLLVAFPVLRVSPTYGALGVMYFALYKVGQTFLWFQWDILLLETTFLCVLVAPLLPSYDKAPHSNITLWLVRWLSFRLMFASGVVKLTSGCPAWWGLTAMNWHYESQCIPTPLAWLIAQQPECLHKLSVVSALLIEIPFPFLFFSPVPVLKAISVYAQVFFMILIMLSGNYNFFNILTCALCITSLDDTWLPRVSTLVSYLSPVTIIAGGGCAGLKALVMFPFKLIAALVNYPFALILKKENRKFEQFGTSLSVVALLGVCGYVGRLYFNVGADDRCAEIQFNMHQFDSFLSHAVPMAIVIGVISLIWTIAQAMKSSFVDTEGGLLWRNFVCLQTAFVAVLVITMFSISLIPLTELDQATQNKIPASVQEIYHRTRSMHLTNSYGLFRSMTGVGGRPEVVLEGSNRHDGGWKEFEFMYKPGALDKRPPLIIPHQPRLDWQMWFAALGTYNHNPWIINLAYQMLDNSTDVYKLLQTNPFPDKPPRYIRAVKYTYHYTKLMEGSGRDWWKREYVKEYFPPLSLHQPTLRQFLERHGLTKEPPRQPDSPIAILPYLERIRWVVDKTDPCVFIWTISLVSFLPHFKAVRFRFSLFGVN